MTTLSSKTTIATGAQEKFYGINIIGDTAKFTYNISVPRDSSADGITQTYRLIVDFF